jgi:hypothetical protein
LHPTIKTWTNKSKCVDKYTISFIFWLFIYQLIFQNLSICLLNHSLTPFNHHIHPSIHPFTHSFRNSSDAHSNRLQSTPIQLPALFWSHPAPKRTHTTQKQLPG